jgi:PAS domain S-box-containing protein
MSNSYRKQAENRISDTPSDLNNIDKIVHELQVHQIELEHQNDELRRSAEALELSHKKYSDLFNHAPIGYFLLNDKYHIINMNYAAAAMLRKDKESFISKPITQFIHPDSQDTIYFHLQDVFQSDQTKLAEIVFKRADRSIFYAQVQSIRDSEEHMGRTIRMAVIDITERKNDEINLKRFRAAIDSSVDNIFLMNFEDLRIIDVNKSACINLGYTREEFLSMGPEAILFQCSKQELLNKLKKFFSNNSTLDYTIELKHKRNDGSVFDVEVFVKSIEINDHKILVAVARDITERMKSQEKLQSYANELKELNEGKDKFLSIISHDLRGPFLGIKGYTQMLIEDFDQMSKEEIMSSLHSINESSKDLYTLVDNLLKWSRLELGKVPYEPMSFNLYEALDPMIRLLSGVAQNKNISLENMLQKEVLAYADRLMLISVAQNLISNAIKFSHQGGVVSISSYQEEGFIWVEVKDNGVGMSSEMLEKIFTLNKEHTSRGTAGEKGTGFGMLIAKEMIHKMGGEIKVESQQGAGSVFKFSLNTAR